MNVELEGYFGVTNDDAVYIRKKIAILKKAGRTAEAASEQAKLPPESRRKLRPTIFRSRKPRRQRKKTRARAMYKRRFGALMNDHRSRLYDDG